MCAYGVNYLDRVNEAGETHSRSEWHYSLGLGPRLHKKEKAN